MQAPSGSLAQVRVRDLCDFCTSRDFHRLSLNPRRFLPDPDHNIAGVLGRPLWGMASEFVSSKDPEGAFSNSSPSVVLTVTLVLGLTPRLPPAPALFSFLPSLGFSALRLERSIPGLCELLERAGWKGYGFHHEVGIPGQCRRAPLPFRKDYRWQRGITTCPGSSWRRPCPSPLLPSEIQERNKPAVRLGSILHLSQYITFLTGLTYYPSSSGDLGDSRGQSLMSS